MTVEAHAKVNLTLEVFGTRPDGYHSLRSLVVPVSLCDTLEIEPAEDATSDSGYGEDDLAVRAARILGVGAKIHIVKRIPAGGGLGGGSADAAATLLALNELYRLCHSRTALAEIGAKIGSDVPALVLGGPVLMEGRGERVSPVADLPSLNIVLASAGVSVSTPAVYAAYAKPREMAPLNESPTGKMLAALASGNVGRIAAALQNDLEDAAIAICPRIAEVLAALRSAGALGVGMSGSGSTCFGLFESADSAETAAKELLSHGIEACNV